MAITPVWVLLYYTGEEVENNDRDPVEIEPPLPKNIGALKKRLKENELKEELHSWNQDLQTRNHTNFLSRQAY